MPSAASSPTVYHVACTCGKELTVTAGQAGAQVPCECGAVVDVPTIRELRRQSAEATPTGAPPAARKQADLRAAQDEYSRTALAVSGAGLFLVGLVIFGSLFLFQRSLPQEVDPNFIEWVDTQRRHMGEIPEDQLWLEWEMARDRGLGQHQPFDEVANQQRARGALLGAYSGLAVSGLGGVLLLISLLMPRRKRA